MAKISNQTEYAEITPEAVDYVVGTDVSDMNQTKTFTVGAISDYVISQVESQIQGWARYDDGTYTSANKLPLTDGVVITLPNDASNVVSSPNAPALYSSVNQKIQATAINNCYILTVVFKASAPNTNTTHLDFKMSGPGEFDRINKALNFYKANDQEQNFHEVYQYYADQDFVDNGVTLTINSAGGNAEVWDIIYFIQRTQ